MTAIIALSVRLVGRRAGKKLAEKQVGWQGRCLPGMPGRQWGGVGGMREGRGGGERGRGDWVNCF